MARSFSHHDDSDSVAETPTSEVSEAHRARVEELSAAINEQPETLRNQGNAE